MQLTFGPLLSGPAAPDPPARVWRDHALAAAIVVGLVLELAIRDDVVWAPAAAVAALFVIWPIYLRRTRPLLAVALGFLPASALGAVGALVTGEAVGLNASVALITVPYALTRWGSGRQIRWGLPIVVLATVIGGLSSASVGDFIGGVIFMAVVVELGVIVRLQDRSRREVADQARSLERERIARELHDTVAHHVSAIAVQAQAGRAVAARSPDAAGQALAVIEEAASRTLVEMRQMVGTLRGDDPAGPLAPQRGVDAIASLAGSFEPGAPNVVVEVSGPTDGLSPSVGAAVYRLAQESVTNAVRHARRASRIDVAVIADAQRVRLVVTDDGEPREAAHRPGYGLIGMAERAALLGGSLTAGPLPGRRGWRVEATLPREPGGR